jgi:hypothetical protein
VVFTLAQWLIADFRNRSTLCSMKSRKSGAQETLPSPKHPSINAVTTTQVRNRLLGRCLRFGGIVGVIIL